MADTEPSTERVTIIERRGGGGTVLIGLVLLVAVLVGAWYLFSVENSTTAKNNAVAGAAKSVGSAADKVGDAVSGGGSGK